MESKLWI